ncbi:AsmA family protein [Kaarinaea lacus]
MKIFKITAILVGIVLLLVLIPIAVLVSIDINNYKDVLADAVEKQTGRQLHIQGSIDKSFFPWLGIHIGALQLSNAAEFGDAPFVKLKEVQVNIKLLPLFKREIVVDTVVIHGLQLNLARNAQGVSNWDDLMKRQEIPATTEPKPREPAPSTAPAAPKAPITEQIAALHIGGIDIRDAAVVWEDRQAAGRYELSALNVQTGELQWGQAFPADVSFTFNATQPQVQGKLQWSALVDAQPQTQRYGLQDLKLVADISGAVLPIPQLSLTVGADVDSDLAAQTANVSKLTLSTLGIELSGSGQVSNIMGEPDVDSQLQWHVKDAAALAKGLQTLMPPEFNAALLQDASAQINARLSLSKQTAQLKPVTVRMGELSVQAALQARQIVDNPTYNGSINVESFNSQPLLQKLGGELPKMADESALTQVALSTEFQGGLDTLSLKPLTLNVDDTKMSGFAAVNQFADPRIEFTLNINAIDVDRYLPPHEEIPPSPQTTTTTTQAPVAASATDEEIPLPMEMLRKLRMKGDLSVGQLKAKQVKLAQLQVGLNASDGVLRADPVQAQLYQGSSTSRVTLDVRQDTPIYTVSEVLKGVEFGPLVKELMSDDYVSGIANVQANITTQGRRVSELKQQLNGSFGFDFANGVVKYLDLADILIADYAKYLRKALPKDDPGKTTAFRILKGTANVTNGVVSNQDMYLQSARFEVFGEGNVDIAKETIDYTADTQIHNPTNKMIEYGLDKLQGTRIPVHFRGSFTEPTYGVDWEGTLRQAAKKSLKREQEKLKQDAKQSLKDQEQKLKDKADQEKEDELRKLEEKLKQEEQKLKDKADDKKDEELRKLKEKLKGIF